MTFIKETVHDGIELLKNERPHSGIDPASRNEGVQGIEHLVAAAEIVGIVAIDEGFIHIPGYHPPKAVFGQIMNEVIIMIVGRLIADHGVDGNYSGQFGDWE